MLIYLNYIVYLMRPVALQRMKKSYEIWKTVTKNAFFIKTDVSIREKAKDKNILNMDGLMGWKVTLKNKAVILMAWY